MTPTPLDWRERAAIAELALQRIANCWHPERLDASWSCRALKHKQAMAELALADLAARR